MGVFERLLRRSTAAATEDAPEPAAGAEAGAGSDAADEAAGTEAVEAGSAAREAARGDGPVVRTAADGGIPRQQSAGDAADSGAGEDART